MNTTQVQLKLSLSQQLNDLLQSKAIRLGVPATQFVKHLIIKEVEDEQYPMFEASKRTIRNAKKAMREIDKSVVVNDVHKFFKEL